jgi:hypothetical protein
MMGKAAHPKKNYRDHSTDVRRRYKLNICDLIPLSIIWKTTTDENGQGMLEARRHCAHTGGTTLNVQIH